MSRYRCPLARLLPEKPDAEQIKRDGWKEQGILVVAMDDPRLDMIEREFVKQLGNTLYGDAKR